MIKKRTLNEYRQEKTFGYVPPIQEELVPVMDNFDKSDLKRIEAEMRSVYNREPKGDIKRLAEWNERLSREIYDRFITLEENLKKMEVLKR